jgi:hypothetical protein
MNLKELINEWVAASNAFDTQRYLDFYFPDAVLDDSSVGRRFVGRAGIKDYFESYFIGYNTNTKIVTLNILGDYHAYLEVLFTGSFPEGEIKGSFDLTFKDKKISFIKAKLIH